MVPAGLGQNPAMTHVWQVEIDELAHRKALAAQMGGAERVARQKAAGKLTVRERFDLFCDPGTFSEIGAVAGVGTYDDDGNLVGFTPSNVVAGVAEVDGRPVVVSGDDFTVRAVRPKRPSRRSAISPSRSPSNSAFPTSVSSMGWAGEGR